MISDLFVFLFLTFVLTITARKGHLTPLGDSGSVVPLPTDIYGFPRPEIFLKDYVLKNKPLVMRKAVLDMPAVRLWSDEYMRLKSAAVDQEVAVEFGKKETRKGGSTMKFSAFLRQYNESDIYLVNAVPTALNEDVTIPWPLQCQDYQRSYEDNVMWFSSGGTKSVLHHDDYENLNCLLRGRKRFLFINTTRYKDIEKQIIDVRDGSYGTVDVERVDLDKYPFFTGMEFFSVDMKAGDCVYSPHLWIHQVESWDSNIAVNVWWLNEINKLVNVSNCNREYDRSMTFNRVAFHKTTEITDPQHPNTVIHALRHGISRMVFRAAGSDYTDHEQFIEILSGNKQLSKQSADILRELYSSMDANGNDKLEITDLDVQLSEDASQNLLSLGAEWLKEARLHDYPLPVDFSNDEYKSMHPFTWKEMEGTPINKDDLEVNSSQGKSYTIRKRSRNENENSIKRQKSTETIISTERAQTPVLDTILRTSVGERDEL